MIVYIYDVSEHQGPINWAVYPSQAVIVRLNYGSQYVDRQADLNVQGARQRCRARGWYTYLVAGQDPEPQADVLARILEAHGGLQAGEFVACDDEEGVGDQAPRVEAYFNRLHGRLQESADEDWAYSGLYFMQAHLGSLPTGVHRWIAAYGQAEPTDLHDLWQFTSSAHVAGITGNVDCSIFHGSIDQLLALVGGDMFDQPDRDKLDRIFQILTATDAAKDDAGNPIDDHWAAGYSLSHIRTIEAKLAALAVPTVDVQALTVALTGPLSAALAPHLPPTVDPAAVAKDVLAGMGKALGSA